MEKVCFRDNMARRVLSKVLILSFVFNFFSIVISPVKMVSAEVLYDTTVESIEESGWTFDTETGVLTIKENFEFPDLSKPPITYDSFFRLAFESKCGLDFKADVMVVIIENEVLDIPVSLRGMFYGMTNLEAVYGLRNIYTVKVKDMSYMFQDCSRLEYIDVSSLKTVNVQDMSSMFGGCSSLSQVDLSSFDTSNVIYIQSMFWDCTNLTYVNFGEFDTSSAVTMNGMFRLCSNLSILKLSSFRTKSVKDMDNMFFGCKRLKKIYVGSGWETEGKTGVDMFWNCIHLQGQNGTSFREKEVVDITYAHMDKGEENPGYLSDESMVGKTEKVLYDLNAYSINDSGWTFDTESKILSLNWNFEFPDVSLPPHNVDNFFFLAFESKCGFDFRTEIKKVEIKDKLIYKPRFLRSMFLGMTNLEEINGLNNINTSNVGSMSYMFMNCSSLKEIDLRSFDTGETEELSDMFYGCESLTSLDLSSFNVAKVVNFDGLFMGCKKIKQIYVSELWNSDGKTGNMIFTDCYSLAGGTGTRFRDYSVQDLSFAHIDEGEKNPGYFTIKGDSEDTSDSLIIYDMDAGSVEESGWTFDTETGVLTINENYKYPVNVDGSGNNYFPNPSGSFERKDVKIVDIKSGITDSPRTLAYFFSEMTNLTEIKGLENIDTSKVTNMSHMFYLCKSLRSLDLSSFDTSNVTDMKQMFCACEELVTIYVSDKWDVSKVEESTNMFYDCSNLVGEQGTTMGVTECKNEKKTTHAYAHVDEGKSNPGYLTYKSPDMTATIIEFPSVIPNLVCDGDDHALITPGEAENGTLVYSLTGEKGSYSEEIPSAKDAGTYIVYYKAVGEEGYYDSVVKTLYATIKSEEEPVSPTESAVPTPTPTPIPVPMPTVTPTAVQTIVPTVLPTPTFKTVTILTPAQNPTVAPTTSTNENKKGSSAQKTDNRMAAPKIKISKGKIGKIRFCLIKLKKYKGSYVEIYVKKGKGKYKKIKLKNNRIKKYKGKFKLKLNVSKVKLRFKVRTYKKKGKKKIFSKYAVKELAV